MCRLIILFILGVIISSLRCQPIEKRKDVTSDSTERTEGGTASPLELAAERSMATDSGAKSTSRPRPPNRYFEFHPLEEPPPPGFTGLFELWFSPSLEEDPSA